MKVQTTDISSELHGGALGKGGMFWWVMLLEVRRFVEASPYSEDAAKVLMPHTRGKLQRSCGVLASFGSRRGPIQY